MGSSSGRGKELWGTVWGRGLPFPQMRPRGCKRPSGGRGEGDRNALLPMLSDSQGSKDLSIPQRKSPRVMSLQRARLSGTRVGQSLSS